MSPLLTFFEKSALRKVDQLSVRRDDTVFGSKAGNHEEIEGLLNAGHRKGAVAGRCVMRGKAIETEEIPAYCAVALAGLGNLPDTILSRSVVVRMRRRAPGETVDPFRRRLCIKEGERLRAELAASAFERIGDVIETWPDMPKEIKDRDADVWEALLVVADAAGGEWPRRARRRGCKACEPVEAGSSQSRPATTGGHPRDIPGQQRTRSA